MTCSAKGSRVLRLTDRDGDELTITSYSYRDSFMLTAYQRGLDRDGSVRDEITHVILNAADAAALAEFLKANLPGKKKQKKKKKK